MVFHPDHCGIANYSSGLAFGLSKEHDVSVVTGFPFYPNWQKNTADVGRLFRVDNINNCRVFRGYLFVPKHPTTVLRIIQEIIFIFFASINFLRLKEKPDVIVIFTTPVSLGLVGVLFKQIFRCKLVINVQDLQIEAAEGLEMLNKSILLRLLKWLEAFSYRNADAVTSISDGMITLLENKGVPGDKLLLVPNWIDVQKAVQAGTAGRFRAAHGIDDTTTLIAYAGNIGKKQGVRILVDMAETLASHDNVIVLIVGEGGDLDSIKRYASDKNIPNLKFIPFLDSNAYADFLCDADLIVIPQKKVPFDVYFPSKLLGIMAKSKPVLIIGDKESELFKVVKENDLGFVANYGDMTEILHAVQIFLSQKDIVCKYQENARNFVEQYDANLVISDFSNKLATMSEGKRI